MQAIQREVPSQLASILALVKQRPTLRTLNDSRTESERDRDVTMGVHLTVFGGSVRVSDPPGGRLAAALTSVKQRELDR